MATNYRIFDVEGRSLRFRGKHIATLHSCKIATSHGVIWFELNAFDRNVDQWVVTIAQRDTRITDNEVIAFYSTMMLAAAEDFLYDFEPELILPSDLIADDSHERRSLMLTVDNSYYATVRRLVREMKEYQEATVHRPVDWSM